MKKIIIDNRMRKEEKKYLKKLGYKLIELPTQKNIYPEISSHVDIFFCKIKDKIIVSPSLEEILPMETRGVIIGHAIPEKEYPNDIRYNAAIIGNNLVHNLKYTDYMIKKYAKQYRLNLIPVKQGYSKCSISVLDNNSCITSDKGIYIELIKNQIDVLYAKEDNIKLLNEKGQMSQMTGFIGGATTVLKNKFILFGDSDRLKNKDEIIKFVESKNLEFVDFKGLDIIDYGSVVEVE